MLDNESFKSAYPKRTICEVLREIWDLTDIHPNGNPYKTRIKIRIKLEEALVMAKKMNVKLNEYHDGWEKDMGYENNRDYEQDLTLRQNR